MSLSTNGCGSYGFQGYNVYQGASQNGPWERIATYDIVDGTKIILDLELDENTGELLEPSTAKLSSKVIAKTICIFFCLIIFISNKINKHQAVLQA